MASIYTMRTVEELALVDQVMGESYNEMWSFETVREAQRIRTMRQALVELYAAFDEFCESCGAKVCLYSKSLQGVLSYGDFVPGVDTLDVAIFREDYDKVTSHYDALSEGTRKKLIWKLDRTIPKTKVRNVYPFVTAKSRKVVKDDEGEVVFGEDSLPLAVRASFKLTIYDNVPDDFFTRKKFYRQMKRRNSLFKSSIEARFLEHTFENTVPPKLHHRLIPLRWSSWWMHHKASKYRSRDTEQVACVSGTRSFTVPRSDFGELARRPFAGIEVRCPDRPNVWASEPILETTPELRRLQEDAKEIVVEIDRICQVLGIRYFCCGGTMLGYVRHGGFIPWDDDIDIGMLREDYETFKAKAGEVIDSERFFLQTRKTDPNIPYLFSKVRMNGTEYLTDYNLERDFHKGICVDVFPFDYIPNGRGDQESFMTKALAKARKHHAVVNRQYPEYFKKSTETHKDLDWLIGQVVGRALAKRYWSRSLDDTQKAYDEFVSQNNASATERKLQYVASFIPTYTMAKVEDLFPTQRVNFDGIDVMIPKEPEKFLRMQYGNYMVMPYPHQRAGHDLLLWSDKEGVGGGRRAEEAEA